MKTFHIFCGGELRDSDFISISEGDTVICADRGLFHAISLGISPQIVVGDFDSYCGELPDNAEIFRSVPEKDDTDTMLAVKLAIERGAEKILIYGAFGGRFDHTAANIQTLKYALDHGCTAILADCDNIVMMQGKGCRQYERREGWYFSFFAYSQDVTVNLSGVKYPLENAVVADGFPLGVSNEITGECANLDVIDGTALVVLSKM